MTMLHRLRQSAALLSALQDQGVAWKHGTAIASQSMQSADSAVTFESGDLFIPRYQTTTKSGNKFLMPVVCT